MKKLITILLALFVLISAAAPALAQDEGFGEPESVALVIGGNQITNGRGFLNNFTYITQSDMDAIAASASGESTYRLGLGDSFSELMTFSAFENHGTPLWQWRRVYGFDLALLAEALGIDVSQVMSISVIATDGMTKTLSDAFGINTKRYTFDTSGEIVSEIGPVLALYETIAETEVRGDGSYPAIPALGADSADRVQNVFCYGQTSTDEITTCYWVKYVFRLRFGAEDVALTVTGANGKSVTASSSGMAQYGAWSARFDTVRAVGIPLTELLDSMGVSVGGGQAVEAVSLDGETLTISPSALSGAFVAWEAVDNGSGVQNETPLRIYCTDGSQLADLVSMSVVEYDGFTDMGGHAWALEAVEALSSMGIVNGVGSGEFAPDRQIKRGDFILMLDRAFGFAETDDEGFSDVPEDAYYADAITRAKALGIAMGSDGKFRPEDSLTRQEGMTLICRAMASAGFDMSAFSADLTAYADYSEVASWATSSVEALVGAGVINGKNGLIDPAGSLTRAELAVALYRALSNSNAR